MSSALSTPAVVLLGVIAVGSITQAVFLVVVALEMTALARRLDDLQKRLVRDIHPLVADLTRATRSLAAASDLTERQVRRIDDLVTATLTRFVEVERVIEETLVPPASRVAGWIAALRGVRAVMGLYRGLRG